MPLVTCTPVSGVSHATRVAQLVHKQDPFLCRIRDRHPHTPWQNREGPDDPARHAEPTRTVGESSKAPWSGPAQPLTTGNHRHDHALGIRPHTDRLGGPALRAGNRHGTGQPGATTGIRPHHPADLRTRPAQVHGTGRAQHHATAALRGHAAERCAQRGHRADRRPGLRRVVHFRRTDTDADPGPACRGRASVQQLPHHRLVLADPRGAEVRTQSPYRQCRVHHGNRHRLPRQHRPHSEPRGTAGRDDAPERLQHRRLRQVA